MDYAIINPYILTPSLKVMWYRKKFVQSIWKLYTKKIEKNKTQNKNHEVNCLQTYVQCLSIILFTTNLETADSNCHELFDRLEQILQFWFFFVKDNLIGKKITIKIQDS